MKVLCDLTPVISSVAERGRATGNITKFSYKIGSDSWNLAIYKQAYKSDNSEYPPLGECYCKGFIHLLSHLVKYKEYGVTIESAVPKIISALEKNTGKKFNQTITYDNLEELGNKIDLFFQCRHTKWNDVYKRVFKADKEEV